MTTTRTVTTAITAALLAGTLSACGAVTNTVEHAAQHTSTGSVAGGSVGSDSTTMVVDHVADGDTVSLRPVGSTAVKHGQHGVNKTSVRVLGIDAPEIAHPDQHEPTAQCGGNEAKAFMEQLLPKGSTVTLSYDPTSDRTDRFGRTLGILTPAGSSTSVNETMVTKGMAEAWKPKSAKTATIFAHLQAEADKARADKVGSWATCPSMGRAQH